MNVNLKNKKTKGGGGNLNLPLGTFSGSRGGVGGEESKLGEGAKKGNCRTTTLLTP